MPKHTKIYPIQLHGCGGANLPADREIYRKTPERPEGRP